MRKEVFNSIMLAAVRIHETNRAIPGNWSSDDGYVGYMERLKEKYDEWCKPRVEDDQGLSGENT